MAIAELSRPDPASVETARAALADLLGADRVLTGEDVLAQHGHDESFHPEARPDVVVWPRSTEEAAGIVRIAAKGLPLDPNQHQAMLEIPSAEAEPGTIVQEMQAGYMMKDRLLRPALVGVAKKG